jgi:hypothetical protein
MSQPFLGGWIQRKNCIEMDEEVRQSIPQQMGYARIGQNDLYSVAVSDRTSCLNQ